MLESENICEDCKQEKLPQTCTVVKQRRQIFYSDVLLSPA
jgi:hypothetical protein